jgi:hypothetical protein
VKRSVAADVPRYDSSPSGLVHSRTVRAFDSHNVPERFYVVFVANSMPGQPGSVKIAAYTVELVQLAPRRS